MTVEDFRRVTEVTYLGVVYGTLTALRRSCHATKDPSCRWGRRSPTAGYRCRRRTVERSTPFRASAIPCVPSCSTTPARSASRWFHLPAMIARPPRSHSQPAPARKSAEPTDEPEDPLRRHNLWEAVDDGDDCGAYGRFEQRSRSVSWQLWATEHRSILGALAILTAAGVLVVGRTQASRSARRFI